MLSPRCCRVDADSGVGVDVVRRGVYVMLLVLAWCDGWNEAGRATCRVPQTPPTTSLFSDFDFDD